MVIQKKYINSVEHLWYDSSNLVYTACYNGARQEKTLKVVFKGGRTYIYKDVDLTDYVLFTRATTSNGEAFNKNIVKKYKGIRVSDTDLDKLEELRQEYAGENKKIEDALSPLNYILQINDNNGEFRLILDGKTIFEGVEGQVSIVNLLNSMHIPYDTMELSNALSTEQDFIDNVNEIEPIADEIINLKNSEAEENEE